MVALVEAPQPLEDLGSAEESVEALCLDPQALLQRPAPAALGGLEVGPDRGLGQRRDLFARSIARSRQVPLGTTSLTRPISRASAESITRPVTISSIARRQPTIRGRRWVPPSARPMFQRRQVTPKVACSSATARWHQQTHSNPPA